MIGKLIQILDGQYGKAPKGIEEVRTEQQGKQRVQLDPKQMMRDRRQ
jgi:hypothetical protein